MIKIILLLVIVDINLCESLTLSKGLNKRITIKPKKRIELNQNKYVLKGTNYIEQEVHVWKEKDYNQSYVFESMNKSIPIDTLKFNSITYFKVDNTRRINFGCFMGLIPIGIFLYFEHDKIPFSNNFDLINDNEDRKFAIGALLFVYLNPLTSKNAIFSTVTGGTIGLIGAKVRKKLKSKEGRIGSNGWNIVPN